MVHENTIPWEIHRGRKLPRMDFASSQEEADVILTKHAILCGGKPYSKTKALTDDTENFALTHSSRMLHLCVISAPVACCMGTSYRLQSHAAWIRHILDLNSCLFFSFGI